MAGWTGVLSRPLGESAAWQRGLSKVAWLRWPWMRRARWCWACSCLACLCAAWPLMAQAQPGPASAPRAAPAEVAPPSITVRAFAVEGNSLLPAERLDAVLEPFLGAGSLGRWREAAAAVQALYRDAGWGGVIAFVPAQSVDDGRVRIRVVEGRVAAIEVQGQQRLSAAAVRAAVPDLQVGRTPALRRIDAQVQMANENPSRQLQLRLEPGREPASIDARIGVTESDPQRLSLRADNSGSASSGRWRTALGWQHAAVGGSDAQLSVELQTAPSDVRNVRIASANGRLPMPHWLTTLDAFAAWSDLRSGDTATAAGDLDFQGRGSVLGLRATRHLLRREGLAQRASLGLEWRDYRNQCAIEGLPEEACGAAGASVAMLPLNLNYSVQRSGARTWSFSLGLQGNLGAGGRHAGDASFDAVRPGAERHYTLLRLAANWDSGALPWLGEGSVAALLSAQASASALVPGEQFGLGGAQSVRGYDERELSGDRGAQLSVELASANLLDRLWGAPAQARLLLLADAGEVRNVRGEECAEGRSRCRLGALGVGLRLARGGFSARLDVARAHLATDTTARGDVRAHASFLLGF